MTSEDTTKRAAQYMVRHGIANPVEIAELSGRSRQIVRHWALEYPEARSEFLAKQWAKAVKWASKRS